MEIHDIILNDFKPTSKEANKSLNSFKKDEYNLIVKLKKKADKAFKDGKFEKAYNLYNQALQFDHADYDLIACLIGAALNLGYIDEVFEKSDLLIKMDPTKAQGYYLKGIANDLIFKFDIAIDFFLQALEYEKDHSNIIIKNLVKTLIKYVKKEDSVQIDVIIDLNDETENLLKLVELTDQLMKKRTNNQMVVKILNYIQHVENDNYKIKTELLMMSGKFFKSEKNYDKAIITFEECYYLANLHEDYKLKIKSIVSISSCYLEMSDLHKVIYYYHKLIDIESYLLTNPVGSSSSASSVMSDDNMINIELRVAIRQNLFTAHYKLGKLRICCYYLKEIIDIIDSQITQNESLSIEVESFDLIQIKIDASIELIKLYLIFEEFIKMKELLDKMLKFVENIIDEANLSIFTEKQVNSLRYFKIKCYSYMGICLAGLRDFRLSNLSTRKCLCLIDKEIQACSNKNETESNLDSTLTSNLIINESFVLNSLKVECLLDASEASSQIIKTFQQMKEFNFDLGSFLSKNVNKFDLNELKILAESLDNRVKNAKSAYLLSKTLIDPSLRAQTTFNVGISLYENQLYQSAAYYFSEVLSIPTVLLENKPGIENRFYSDASPDYRLEASVYLHKCLLLIDHFEMESIVKVTDTDEPKSDDYYEVLKSERIDIENIYKNLNKTIETIIKHFLKWKLHETNRSSFLFCMSDLEKIKHDQESSRLRNLLKICCECLIYICYKLNKKEECLVYMELENFILSSNMNDLIDLNLVDMQNEFNFSSLSYENFTFLLAKMETSLIRYKFIFECKLLYIFVLEPNKNKILQLTYSNRIKLSQILRKYDAYHDLLKLYDSKFDYMFKKLELLQNEWIKLHLHEIEYRNCPTDSDELAKIRIKNRLKEKNYFNFLTRTKEKIDSNFIYKYKMESIDLLNLKLSEKLKENIEKLDLDKLEEEVKADMLDQFTELINQLNELFFKIVIEPVQSILVEYRNSKNCLNLLIDSKYTKMFVYTFNLLNNEQEQKISYLIVFDTFLKYSNNFLNSVEKDLKDELEFTRQRQDVLESPTRSKFISDKMDLTNSERVHKSLIKPRYTSNPRKAVNLLNQDKDSNYILIRNDHVQRLKNKLDSSVGVLISQTASGTDAKKSNLEILEYKQVNRQDRCCLIGCPEIPKKFNELGKFQLDKFLKNGLEQMVHISKIMHVEPIFSDKMTKQELIHQLENNNLIFLSTLSSNESDSFLICSQSNEFPSSYDEFDRYCKFTVHDLELIDLHRCNLLVLNCYSTLSHKPRFDLAKKILSRGCKSVLLVLSPLIDKLMTSFYSTLFENLKQETEIHQAYSKTLLDLSKQHSDLAPIILNSSFCLVGTKPVKISIDQIAKSMAQLNVDKTFEYFKSELNMNYLNSEPAFSILSQDYLGSLEKTLTQLQILIKFLLNTLIRDSDSILFSKNAKYEQIFMYINELISKSIFYIKSNKVGPEPLNSCIEENTTAQNLLKCLGFSIQHSSVYAVRDEKDKKVILFPDHRYLDLNLRLTHVMACLINLCFKINTENSTNLNQTNQKIKSVIYNLESLLPIDDKNLLRCLIDIIALTKFSPEIIISITDYSVYYAFNYYEYINQKKNRTYINLMDKDLYKWNLSSDKNYYSTKEKQVEISSSDLTVKYSINNKVVNFLLAIGFEIIGPWIRFNDTELNRIFLDLVLKFLTSFTLDRDMSLYKDLNINVMGQRSAATRGLMRTASNLNFDEMKYKKDEHYKLNVTGPWCSVIETQRDMDRKMEFAEKYSNLSKKISKQRADALKHHFDYVMKQSALNTEEEINELLNKNLKKYEETKDDGDKKITLKKIKYKTGGGPSKSRVIANERYRLSYEEIEKIRKYSHFVCQKNVEKIELEFKEKSQKLMLPLIKK